MKKIETVVRPAEVAAAMVNPNKKIPKFLSNSLFFNNKRKNIGQYPLHKYALFQNHPDISERILISYILKQKLKLW